MRKFVTLPDGRYEEVRHNSVVDLCVPEAEFTPILFPIISNDIVTQARYENMRLDGQSHNFAEMIALRRFPGIKTDAIFNESKFSGESGQIPKQQKWLRRQAEDAGVATNGKWYCSGLASFPGDPTAWVGDRGDVLRIAREKNLTVHGYVEHEGHETDGGGDIPISDDIIEDEVSDILESNPFAEADDVREEVYAIRTGAVDDNPLLCGDHFTTDIP